MSLDFAHDVIECILLLHSWLIDHLSTRKSVSYSEAEAQTAWDEWPGYCSRAESRINSAIKSNLSVPQSQKKYNDR